jgi:hypothetical protein
MPPPRQTTLNNVFGSTENTRDHAAFGILRETLDRGRPEPAPSPENGLRQVAQTAGHVAVEHLGTRTDVRLTDKNIAQTGGRIALPTVETAPPRTVAWERPSGPVWPER